MSQHLSSTELSRTPAKTPRESNIWWIARDWKVGATNPNCHIICIALKHLPIFLLSSMASAIEISKISHLIIKAGKSLSYFNKILKIPTEHFSTPQLPWEKKNALPGLFVLFAMFCFQSVVICHGSLSDEQKEDSCLGWWDVPGSINSLYWGWSSHL